MSDMSIPPLEQTTSLQPTLYPFRFTGSGKEFFGIWSVNILLVIVTLGFYLPWAKVRTRSYFYSHTNLSDSSFQYLADPWTIFKGRMIAMVIFMAWVLATQFYPVVGGIISTVLFAIGMPWVINRALKFNAVNSAWRGIRFDFKGNYKEAFLIFSLGYLAMLLTLFLLLPWWLQKSRQYIVSNSYYGETAFQFSARTKDFYCLAGKLLLILIGGAAVIFLANTFIEVDGMFGFLIVYILGAPLYLFLQGYFHSNIENLSYNNTQLLDNQFESRMVPWAYTKLITINSLFILLTLGLYYPWAKVRTASYRADTLSLQSVDLASFVADEKKRTESLGAEIADAFDIGVSGI